MNVVYRDDPSYEQWLQLAQSAYSTDLWCLAETDFHLWKKSFGRRFQMLVAYEPGSVIPIGCICSVTYRHRTRLLVSTVLGLFYVRKEFRGQGIGNELFRRIIANKQQHNLFLNGMSYMVEKYKIHYNFTLQNDWKAIWYQIDPSRVDLLSLTPSQKVLKLSPDLLSKVLSYDQNFQDDLDRSHFLRLFLAQDCADTYVALDESKTVAGYGTARLLINNELLIGPLYANSSKVAEPLLYSLLSGKFQGKYRNLQLQVPSTNPESRYLLEKVSGGYCSKEDYTIGLATRYRLKTDMSRVYSTTEYDISFV